MNPTVAVSAGASALQFIMNLIEDLRIDDGFVVLFDIVLRDLIFIDFCLFGQEVDDEGLLQECVTLVFFIGEDSLYRSGMPFLLAAWRWNILFRELSGNSVRHCAFHKHPVDPLYKFSLFFIDYQFTVGSSVVAKEPFEWNDNLAVSKTFSLTPGAVLGNASGFFLRQRGHDCDEKFSLPIKGPDVFFFKIALDAMLLQLTDGSEGINRVPGKPADRLCDDKIDLSVQRIGYHLFESFAVLCACAGNAFIGVDFDEIPVASCFDVFCVVIDLGLIACELFVVVGGDPGVSQRGASCSRQWERR